MELVGMRDSKSLLVVAGALSFAVAAFQLVITFSIPWSLYFGAPPSIVSNPTLLYSSGVVAAILFFIFGLYALSGAGTFRRLPLLRTGLIVIASLYTLRGLLLIPEAVGFYNPRTSELITLQALWSSFVSLLIGIVYLIGVSATWKKLQKKETVSRPVA
jgi:hypothetical protein